MTNSHRAESGNVRAARCAACLPRPEKEVPVRTSLACGRPKEDGTGGRYKKEPLENGRLDLGFFPLRNGQRLQSQLLAALRTTASQHLAAILRRHSLAEAMLLAALTLLGLISSQHLPHTSYYPGLNGHRHRSNTKDASGLCRCLSVMLRIRYIIDSDMVVCQAQF